MPLTTQQSHRLVAWALGAYWLALFSGTHYPKPPEVVLGANDKVLHFSGYLGLAFLLVALRQVSMPLDRRKLAIIVATAVALASAYGVFDEITQIPVGRDCSLLDWVADTSGAVVGALLAAAAFSSWRRHRPSDVPGEE
jgi:VanZ family protein